MSKNKFSKRLAASLIAAATIGSSGVLSSLTYLPVHAADTDNYAKLLQYSMYFYDGNMCGDDVDSASAFDWLKIYSVPSLVAEILTVYQISRKCRFLNLLSSFFETFQC